jgi:LPS sulfotransferase NodH
MVAALTGISSARYDMNGRGPFTRAYIIAASYRSGSTHLCTRLWETGVLGAPFEYLNQEHEMKYLYSRLGAASPQDYMNRLIACRMSDNGVFGIKVHFHHFRAALRIHPELLQRLRPLQFIFIRRDDKIAQAVSLAKAYQTRAWLGLSAIERADIPLFYSRDFIAACLEEINRQETGWMSWFEARGLQPHVISYEELLNDEQRIVGKVRALLGADSDPRSGGSIPSLQRQYDRVNEEWIARFRAESSAN